MLDFLKDNWGLIATILLAISELLAVIPFVKANSIAQAVLNLVKGLLAPKTQA